MGTCASVHKKRNMGSPKRLFPASASPVKEQQPVDRKDQHHFGTKSPELGSKDEMFFDSRAWLDSDCDDDFCSVNGDFTPSRGSTPNNRPRMPATINANLSSDSSTSSEPSPNSRKRLSELLQETLRSEKSGEGDQDSSFTAKDNAGNGNGNGIERNHAAAPAKQISGPISATSREATLVRLAKSRKDERMWYTARCCLPGLVHTSGFEMRRQKMSPGPCAV